MRDGHATALVLLMLFIDLDPLVALKVRRAGTHNDGRARQLPAGYLSPLPYPGYAPAGFPGASPVGFPYPALPAYGLPAASGGLMFAPSQPEPMMSQASVPFDSMVTARMPKRAKAARRSLRPSLPDADNMEQRIADIAAETAREAVQEAMGQLSAMGQGGLPGAADHEMSARSFSEPEELQGGQQWMQRQDLQQAANEIAQKAAADAEAKAFGTSPMMRRIMTRMKPRMAAPPMTLGQNMATQSLTSEQQLQQEQMMQKQELQRAADQIAMAAADDAKAMVNIVYQQTLAQGNVQR